MNDAPARPGAWIVAGFGVCVGLAAAFLKATLAASMNEAFPATLVAFGIVLALFRGARWRGAFALSLILLTGALLPAAPSTASLSFSTDVPCHLYNNRLDRLTTVLFFPLSTQYAPLWGGLAGVVAALGMHWTLWGALARPLRWLSTGVLAAVLVATVLKARARPGPEAYLADTPVVAALFPTSDAFTKRPESCAWCGEYPEVVAGPMRFQRPCDRQGPDANCHVEVKGDSNPLACVKAGATVLVRDEATLGVWFVEEGNTRYAFRPGPGPIVPRVEITTTDLLRVTRPPPAWIFTLLVGLTVSLFVEWRCRRVAGGGSGLVEALSWDLVGLAATMLSLLAIAPWLRELARGFS